MPSSQTPAHKPLSSKSTPSDARLKIWQKKLPQNPLPINRTIASHVIRLLKDDNCDSEKLAHLIKQDPILCLKLFHCTEKALKQREGDIQHLVHLIGLIGLNKIEQVITKSPKQSNHEEGFQEILSASLFAAHLSSQLLVKRHNASSDRFFLPTLFFNSPLWLMWVAAPKTMSQGQELASRKQQSYIALSVKKLGFRLPDLLSKADSFIHLPELTLKALSINPTKDVHFWAKIHRLNEKKLSSWFSKDKQSKLLFNSIETGIYLLNQYVTAVYLDWNGKHIQRYSDLLCRHLGIKSEQLNTQVIELALSINAPNNFQGLLAPINRVKGLHREPETTENTQKPSSTTPKHTPALNTWLAKIHKSSNVDTALETTLQALTEGIGVEHCIIMEVDDKDIHTQNCYGFDNTSAISDFNYDRSKQKNLFDQLAQRPACISLSSNDIPKAIKNIPQTFTDSCDIKPCGLLSVFHHNKPKAIIYCDHNQWDQKKHHDFKVIGKHLAQTLKQL